MMKNILLTIINRQGRLQKHFSRFTLTLILFFTLVTPSFSTSNAFAQGAQGNWWKVRSVYTSDFDLSDPKGGFYSPAADAFFFWSLTGDVTGVTMREAPFDTAGLKFPLEDPRDMAFDARTKDLFVFSEGSSRLERFGLDGAGRPTLGNGPADIFDLRAVNLHNVQGMAFAPDGRLFLLDSNGNQIVVITPQSSSGFDGDSAVRDGRVLRINLRRLNRGAFLGIAYNPNTGYLYTFNPGEQTVYVLTGSGEVVSTFDLTSLELSSPEMLWFAPSADVTDDPAIQHLYILDGGRSMSASQKSVARLSLIMPVGETTVGAQLVEVALTPAPAAPSPILSTTLIQTIDVSHNAWGDPPNPSSPDPAGVAYWPGHNSLLISDSEVEENLYPDKVDPPPWWVGYNIFVSSLTGTFLSACDATYFTNEPTGIAVNSNNDHFFISDDNGGGKIFEVDPGPDTIYCTSDDMITTKFLYGSVVAGADVDAEGVVYADNMIYIAGGIDSQVLKFSLGPDGVLGGGDDGSITTFDTGALGFQDLEGIEYNPGAGTLFIVSTYGSDNYLGEVSTTGSLINAYDLSYLGNVRSGLAYGPSSINPSVKSIYISSRGVDNNAVPLENDGLIWEVYLDATPPPVAHTITATAGANGSISPSGDVIVLDGDNQSFTITPDTGYVVADVLVDDVSVGPLTSYPFNNVLADHTISASFTLDLNLDTTTTTVSCPGPVIFGGSSSCTATVTRTSGTGTPSGNVTWSVSAGDSGSFGASNCTNPTSATLECAASYTPGAVGDSIHQVSAAYLGDATFSGSSGSQDITVSKADPTILVTPYNLTYDGSPHAAAGTATGVNSEDLSSDLDLSGTTHTNAGTYSTDPWTFTDTSGNYNNAGGTVSDSIAKADAVIVVNSYNVTYDGFPHTSTGTATGVNSEDLSSDLGLSGTTHTTAGDYTGDSWAFTDTTGNYNNASGTVNNNISKATPILSVTNSPVTYDGSPKSATVSGSVPGNVSNILTGGTASQTGAGTYPVTADFVPTDTTNYNSLTAASAGDFVIAKAAPTLSVTNSPLTYNGSPQAAAVDGSVAGTVSNVQYNGSSTLPTDTGVYAVTADFVPDDTVTYGSLTGASAGNFVIDKADPDCTSIAGYSLTYDGNSHTATGTCQGVGSDGTLSGLNLSGTTHTDAGPYNGDAWNFTDISGNYHNASGTVNSTIAKANPDCSSIAGYNLTYDGNSHTATGTCQGVGSDGTLNGLNLSGTTHTGAGTYNGDAWNFTDISGNYNAASGTVNSSIAKATPILSVTNSPVPYSGSPQSATVEGSVPGNVSNVLYDGSGIEPTEVGTYAVTADFTPTDTSNYNTLTDTSAGNFVIGNQAVTVTADSGQSKVYGDVDPTLTYTSDNPSATFSGALGRVAGKNVGTYAITQGTLAGTGGYIIGTFNSAAFNITTKELTVTADDQTILFGDSEPTYTFTYAGFIAGEDQNDLTAQPTCGVLESPHTDPGTYTIRCQAGLANNYAFTYFDGTLVVNAPPTDISLSNASVEENQPLGTLVGTFTTTDPDLGDTFTYSFCGGADDASFTIDADILRTAEVFDFETKNAYQVCIRTDDGNGGTFDKTFGISVTNSGPVRVTFRSQPKYDGWVLESNETSGIGGTENHLSKVLNVGDNAQDKQFRTILSFGTAKLPDNAVVTKVILKVRKAGVVGTDPMTTHNGLVVDIKKGKFYTLPALQINDFQAKPGKFKVGKFPNKLFPGTWYRAVLYSGAYDFINLKGRTQLRLRFQLDDNDDNSADFLKLFSGNAVLANRPQLIVIYYIP